MCSKGVCVCVEGVVVVACHAENPPPLGKKGPKCKPEPNPSGGRRGGRRR